MNGRGCPTATVSSCSCSRRKADEARSLVPEGIDPAARHKAERHDKAIARVEQERVQQGLPATGSFEAVAREWLEVRRSGWAPGYASKIMARLEADVFP